jgi:hypothetical protein
MAIDGNKKAELTQNLPISIQIDLLPLKQKTRFSNLF